MAVTVRFDKEFPVEDWLALYRAADYNAWWTERNAKAAMAYAYLVATAWTEGQMVGTVTVWSDAVNFAWLDDLVVHPDHRRRGIGALVLSETLSEIRRAGVSAIQVRARSGRERFFSRLGFVVQPGMAVMDLLRPSAEVAGAAGGRR